MQTSHIKASLTKLLLLSFARKWSRRTKWSCKVISKKCIAGHITPIKLAHSGYLITSVPFTRFQQDWAAHYIHLSVHSFTKCAMNVNTKYEGDWQKEREKTNREDNFLFVLKNMKPELWDHDMYLLITSHNKSPSFLWACPLHPNNFVQSANFQKPRPRHFDVFWTQERGWGRRLVSQQQALLRNRNVCWDWNRQ